MKYHFAFTGLGLSTLLVLNELFNNGLLESKSVLIIESHDIGVYEKTWSFWEEGKGEWDELLNSHWDKAFFKNEDHFIECLGENLKYKQIESKNFIKTLFHKLKSKVNISLVKEEFISFKNCEFFVEIFTNKGKYESYYLFSSVVSNNDYKVSSKFPLLNQHFIGWFVELNEQYNNLNQPLFMDFSVEQKGNTRFMYVLPFVKNKVLVEYTLFSKELLPEQEYEDEIKLYLNNLGISNYSVMKKEKGNIPMTVFPFWKYNEKRVLHIGTAGGWTKASTGYTFKKTAKRAKEVALYLKNEEVDFRKFHKWNKYIFYDYLFIKVLSDENSLGKKIFSSLFVKVNPRIIFKFLDEETSLIEDLKIILACPKLPFIKALLKKLF